MNMRHFIDIVETSQRTSPPQRFMYHLTDDPKFSARPDFAPDDNAASLMDRSAARGIYLCKSPEYWINSKGYMRPYVAEFEVQPELFELDRFGRWGGEIFVEGEHFDKMKLARVIPVDAHCREAFYGELGWIERARGKLFDTDETIPKHSHNLFGSDYRYPHDARTLPAKELERLERHYNEGYPRWKNG